MKTLEFTIRKLHVSTDSDKRLQKRQPSRVYVNEEALIELTGSKDGGRAIYVEKAVSGEPDEPPVRREATLWKAPEKLDKKISQMYDGFRDACGFKLGEKVRITALGGPIPDAEEVVLEQIPLQEGAEIEPMAPEDTPGWEVLLAGRLAQVEHVYAGLVLSKMHVRGPDRSFIVGAVNGKAAGNARYIDRKTKLFVGTAVPRSESATAVVMPSQKLEVTGVKGMDAQIERLNDLLWCFSSESGFEIEPTIPGIVLHGGHGTGKTMLLDAIANSGWGTVFRIQYKDKLSEIQEMFQLAKLQQPSVVLIDQLERLIDKERNNRAAVIVSLCEFLDSLASTPSKVIIVATCLDFTSDIPEDLKKPNRFTSEIYLPMPDAQGRREILASRGLCVDPDQEVELLNHLSASTHAYNGDDLSRLVNEARKIGKIRQSKLARTSAPALPDLASLSLSSPPEDGKGAPENGTSLGPGSTATPDTKLRYLASDYHQALRLVRPSLMHDINLKPPPIHWDDIGGQETVKLSLRRAVRLSVEPPEVLAQYFDRPPKGFLLYGPPGCSKTMAAQAMATESGLNFFAVKGAELLNMYVGESERAVRRLFQRAREVAPSMIFFDEIDSIAGVRSGFSSSASSGKGGGSGGVNVLTTLLNEMDGFEALHGVVVLAATNRPQALDPALLRPGRFDELIYVSPPDAGARRAIFEKVAAKRKMHKDVDVERLVAATAGYSGAEIKGICAAAGVAAYDRHVSGGLGGNEEGGIRMEDLEAAIRNQKKQITPEMIEGFESWERQFRGF
ncbi:P-loop containing nucleoside triphosphate hydrolase protein [Cladorrhinum samala]|uniref:P-loop containing nucleoside triphosphate hydrolase protein n=1 Tax=Cladorrhinum samala TaxID=585594 RepID=A0AAV9HSB6_9PEZI|nr:P-loop containing nucleoside triphosphate hydrolase protein [Cladorrhinum samala]